MASNVEFVVTAWRNRQELLQLRHDLYSSETDRRQRAVNKVFAWRLRKPDGLPLLLDSTADIVDVLLQDEKVELKHNALRLLYATAISRFVTGVADTQIDLTRDKPVWFPPGKTLQLPVTLLETRHRIVHRHLPSLAELKHAAKESLDWLWEWYWSQLDYAFGISKTRDSDGEGDPQELVRERLNTILKTYVKERRNEIKTRKKDLKASGNALSTYNLRFAPSSTSTPSKQIQNLLVQLLIDNNMVLPADKKLRSSMSGAFLVWSPLLLAFCTSSPLILPIPALLTSMRGTMNATARSWGTVHVESDPVREGMSDWLTHILTSDEWSMARGKQEKTLLEDALIQCFSEPTFWNLKLAAALLEKENIPNREQWTAILHAAKNEGEAQDEDTAEEMEVDIENINEGLAVAEAKEQKPMPTKEKIRGPQKVLGMWKPKPIGWLPEGWEDDE